MRTFKAVLTAVSLLAFGATLTGCGALSPNSFFSAPEGSVEDAQPSEEKSEPSEVEEQQFFDNLVILRAGLVGLDDESRAIESYPDTSWQESEEAVREQALTLGRAACETQIPTSASEPGDRYMIWLSARFLCDERLPDAEASLTQFTSDQMLEAFELSLWRGDVRPDDVLDALSLCTAEVAMGWNIPEDTLPTSEFFCWFMRANAIEQNDSETDFVGMFQESGDPETSFEVYAESLGATPNLLSDLTE